MHEQTIHAAYEAWSRWDIDGVLAVVHPDAEVRPILGANVEADVYRGHEGVRRWFEDLHQEWESFETRVSEIEERGDRALCRFRIHGRGRASGAAIDGELYHLMELREGLIARLEAFRERDEAVRAFEAT
jgi:ketosteroid isomerase-like protein